MTNMKEPLRLSIPAAGTHSNLPKVTATHPDTRGMISHPPILALTMGIQ